MIKVNCDAAVSKRKGSVGLGIIARDCMGKVCAARSITIGQLLEPAAAEAMAGLYAMMRGKDLGGEGVVLEGDALQVINAINSMHPCRRGYSHFIEDIQAGLRIMGNTCVIHTPREANFSAHGLAQDATKLIIDSFWREEISPSICGIVRREEVLPPP